MSIKESLIAEIDRLIETDVSSNQLRRTWHGLISNERIQYLNTVCEMSNEALYDEYTRVQIPTYNGRFSPIDIFKRFVTSYIFKHKLIQLGYFNEE